MSLPYMRAFATGEEVVDFLTQTAVVGQIVNYYGVPHVVIDAGEQGLRLSAKLVCSQPETCTSLHNEADPNTNESHHYGCECPWCMYVYWSCK